MAACSQKHFSLPISLLFFVHYPVRKKTCHMWQSWQNKPMLLQRALHSMSWCFNRCKSVGKCFLKSIYVLDANCYVSLDSILTRFTDLTQLSKPVVGGGLWLSQFKVSIRFFFSQSEVDFLVCYGLWKLLSAWGHKHTARYCSSEFFCRQQDSIYCSTSSGFWSSKTASSQYNLHMYVIWCPFSECGVFFTPDVVDHTPSKMLTFVLFVQRAFSPKFYSIFSPDA